MSNFKAIYFGKHEVVDTRNQNEFPSQGDWPLPSGEKSGNLGRVESAPPSIEKEPVDEAWASG